MSSTNKQGSSQTSSKVKEATAETSKTVTTSTPGQTTVIIEKPGSENIITETKRIKEISGKGDVITDEKNWTETNQWVEKEDPVLKVVTTPGTQTTETTNTKTKTSEKESEEKNASRAAAKTGNTASGGSARKINTANTGGAASRKSNDKKSIDKKSVEKKGADNKSTKNSNSKSAAKHEEEAHESGEHPHHKVEKKVITSKIDTGLGWHPKGTLEIGKHEIDHKKTHITGQGPGNTAQIESATASRNSKVEVADTRGSIVGKLAPKPPVPKSGNVSNKGSTRDIKVASNASAKKESATLKSSSKDKIDTKLERRKSGAGEENIKITIASADDSASKEASASKGGFQSIVKTQGTKDVQVGSDKKISVLKTQTSKDFGTEEMEVGGDGVSRPKPKLVKQGSTTYVIQGDKKIPHYMLPQDRTVIEKDVVIPDKHVLPYVPHERPPDNIPDPELERARFELETQSILRRLGSRSGSKADIEDGGSDKPNSKGGSQRKIEFAGHIPGDRESNHDCDVHAVEKLRRSGSGNSRSNSNDAKLVKSGSKGANNDDNWLLGDDEDQTGEKKAGKLANSKDNKLESRKGAEGGAKPGLLEDVDISVLTGLDVVKETPKEHEDGSTTHKNMPQNSPHTLLHKVAALAKANSDALTKTSTNTTTTTTTTTTARKGAAGADGTALEEQEAQEEEDTEAANAAGSATGKAKGSTTTVTEITETEETEEIRRRRLAKEKAEKEEAERLQKEEEEARIRKQKEEEDRLRVEREEKERLERERLEKERLEKERLERERIESERLEKERIEKERLEKERLEKEKTEREQAELKEFEERERKLKEAALKEAEEKSRLEALEKEKLNTSTTAINSTANATVGSATPAQSTRTTTTTTTNVTKTTKIVKRIVKKKGPDGKEIEVEEEVEVPIDEETTELNAEFQDIDLSRQEDLATKFGKNTTNATATAVVNTSAAASRQGTQVEATPANSTRTNTTTTTTKMTKTVKRMVSKMGADGKMIEVEEEVEVPIEGENADLNAEFQDVDLSMQQDLTNKFGRSTTAKSVTVSAAASRQGTQIEATPATSTHTNTTTTTTKVTKLTKTVKRLVSKMGPDGKMIEVEEEVEVPIDEVEVNDSSRAYTFGKTTDRDESEKSTTRFGKKEDSESITVSMANKANIKQENTASNIQVAASGNKDSPSQKVISSNSTSKVVETSATATAGSASKKATEAASVVDSASKSGAFGGKSSTVVTKSEKRTFDDNNPDESVETITTTTKTVKKVVKKIGADGQEIEGDADDEEVGEEQALEYQTEVVNMDDTQSLGQKEGGATTKSSSQAKVIKNTTQTSSTSKTGNQTVAGAANLSVADQKNTSSGSFSKTTTQKVVSSTSSTKQGGELQESTPAGSKVGGSKASSVVTKTVTSSRVETGNKGIAGGETEEVVEEYVEEGGDDQDANRGSFKKITETKKQSSDTKIVKNTNVQSYNKTKTQTPTDKDEDDIEIADNVSYTRSEAYAGKTIGGSSNKVVRAGTNLSDEDSGNELKKITNITKVTSTTTNQTGQEHARKDSKDSAFTSTTKIDRSSLINKNQPITIGEQPPFVSDLSSIHGASESKIISKTHDSSGSDQKKLIRQLSSGSGKGRLENVNKDVKTETHTEVLPDGTIVTTEIVTETVTTEVEYEVDEYGNEIPANDH